MLILTSGGEHIEDKAGGGSHGLAVLLGVCTEDTGGFALGEHLVGHLRGGERGDILLDQRTELSLVNVPDEDELEATGIAEAAAEELEDSLVVHRLDLIHRQRIVVGVMWVHEASQRVSQAKERVSHTCLDRGDGALLPSCEGRLISTASSEV